MSGCHQQEQFFSANGKLKQPSSYAVAFMKDGLSVDTFYTISCLCSMFVCRSGLTIWTITGASKCSTDLPQGGLLLLYTCTFNGPEDTVKEEKHCFCFSYVHIGLQICDFNFMNLHGFAKFVKITSCENLYVIAFIINYYFLLLYFL